MLNRILIVDDSEGWRTFHTTLIKQLYGDLFEIISASSAKEAINLVSQNSNNPFPIIITDLQMENDYYPKSAGEWLIKHIKNLNEYKRSEIIIISGMHNIEQIAKQYSVNCISKAMLVQNKLLMKYMFEKLMPFLTKI